MEQHTILTHLKNDLELNVSWHGALWRVCSHVCVAVRIDKKGRQLTEYIHVVYTYTQLSPYGKKRGA